MREGRRSYHASRDLDELDAAILPHLRDVTARLVEEEERREHRRRTPCDQKRWLTIPLPITTRRCIDPSEQKTAPERSIDRSGRRCPKHLPIPYQDSCQRGVCGAPPCACACLAKRPVLPASRAAGAALSADRSVHAGELCEKRAQPATPPRTAVRMLSLLLSSANITIGLGCSRGGVQVDRLDQLRHDLAPGVLQRADEVARGRHARRGAARAARPSRSRCASQAMCRSRWAVRALAQLGSEAREMC